MLAPGRTVAVGPMPLSFQRRRRTGFDVADDLPNFSPMCTDHEMNVVRQHRAGVDAVFRFIARCGKTLHDTDGLDAG